MKQITIQIEKGRVRMGKIKPFEKPVGFRDLLTEMTAKKRAVEGHLQQLFQSWGYEEILTPTLEFDETIGKASAISSGKMFKLQDRLGHTLVLKPDMTAPIARVVSSILKDHPVPVRLSYHTNVFRAQENEAGRASELYQSGVELIGEGTPDGDAEVIALAIESLKQLQLNDFQLVVGHTSFLYGILADWVEEKDQQEELISDLSCKNMVGFKQKIEKWVTDREGQQSLLTFAHLQGDIRVLDQAKAIAKSERAKQAIEDLYQVWKLIKIYGLESYITFDLTLVPHMEYYTGMVFVGTVKGIGFPVCGGGRYDSLLDAFGNPQAAIGFAIHLDRILEGSKIEAPRKRKVKVIYDQEHREEALHYVLTRRNEQNISIETQRYTGKNVDYEIDMVNEQGKEIIWFIERGESQNEG